jgi:hypothetical protein
MKRTVRLTLVAVLATIQGIFGILRAFAWIRAGIDLSMQGILLLPILSAIAFTRGKVVLFWHCAISCSRWEPSYTNGGRGGWGSGYLW